MPTASHTPTAQDREGGRGLTSAADSITYRARHRGRFRNAQGEGKLWEVTIIAAGKSLNGLRYAGSVLKEAVPLFVGLPVFSYKFGETEKQEHLPDGAESVAPGGGFAGNRVGQVTKAWWDEAQQEVRGLVAIDDQPTRDRLKNAHERGAIGGADVEEDVEGFSINMEGLRQGDDVKRIVRGGSLDMVTEPAAKGRYLRMVASVDDPKNLKAMSGESEAISTTPEPVAPVKLEEAGTASVRKIASGYGVFVDGKQVGRHDTQDGAAKCAAARNRMKGALEAPEAEVHAAMKKHQEAEGPPLKETKMTASKITEADERVTSIVAMAQAMAELEGEALREAAAQMMAALQALAGGGMEEARPPVGHGQAFDELAASVREMFKGGEFGESPLATKILESIGGPEPVDEKDRTIAALQQRMREQAIGFELTSKYADRIVEGALADVQGLVRTAEGVKVSELDGLTTVEGLEEAVEALLESKPWLRNTAKAAAAGAGDGDDAEIVKEAVVVEDEDEKKKKKAEPRGQEVPLRESVNRTPRMTSDGRATLLAELQRAALNGDAKAASRHRKLRLSSI